MLEAEEPRAAMIGDGMSPGAGPVRRTNGDRGRSPIAAIEMALTSGALSGIPIAADVLYLVFGITSPLHRSLIPWALSVSAGSNDNRRH